MSGQVAGAEQVIAERLMAKASLLLESRRPAEALPLLERLHHLAQVPAQAREARAIALLAMGRFNDAADAAGEALITLPGSAALLQLRGRARLAMGQDLAAADDAAAAVMADSGSNDAKGLLAETLMKLGKPEEAIFLAWRVAEALPQDMSAQLRLAQAFILAGRHAAADELLAALEARAPLLALPIALRAQNKLLMHDAAEAERMTRAALDRGMVEVSLHSVLAHALVAQCRLPEAGVHFRAAARLAPHDAYLAHLASASEGGTPERATDAYISAVFDGYAGRFEAELLGMGYRVPGLIRLAVDRWLAETGLAAIPGPVLDLGCGTGLVGVALLGLTGAGLCGVDLSRNMIAQTRAKGIYTELHQAEFSVALAAIETRYALVAAADLFCYFGHLDEALLAAAATLADGGLMMFSVERSPEPSGWQLGESGRYRHSLACVAAALQQAGLTAVSIAPETIRWNAGEPVEGLFVIARRLVC
jgi:predicted TPR repeat methyltransferase